MLQLMDSGNIDFMQSCNLSRIFGNTSGPLLIAPSLYLKEATADVHFLIEEHDEFHRIPAHKCILAERSPVFFQMFYGPLKEKEDIKITDEHFIISRRGLEGFLQIFYSYDLQISSETVEEIYLLADKYDMEEWKTVCIKFIKKTLHIKTIFVALELAKKFDLFDLKGLCEETFRRNAEKIFSSNEFLEISQDTLKSIIGLELYCCTEFTKFRACVKWAKAACERKGTDGEVLQNCRKELGDCFKLLHFEKMNADDFINFQHNFFDIVNTAELNDILNSYASMRLLNDTDEETDGSLSEDTDSDDTDYSFDSNGSNSLGNSTVSDHDVSS